MTNLKHYYMRRIYEIKIDCCLRSIMHYVLKTLYAIICSENIFEAILIYIH